MTKIGKNTGDVKDIAKKSFLLFKDYGDTFDALSDELAGTLIKHIFQYQNGEDTDLDNPLLKIAFLPIKNQFIRDNAKWEDIFVGKDQMLERLEVKKEQKTSSKRSKCSANGSKSKQTQTNQAVTVTVTDTVINKEDYGIHNHYIKDIKEKKDTDYATWLDGVCRKHGLSNGKIWQILEKFCDHLKVTEKVHRDMGSFKKHFVNWLDKQDQHKMLDQYKTRRVGAL